MAAFRGWHSLNLVRILIRQRRQPRTTPAGNPKTTPVPTLCWKTRVEIFAGTRGFADNVPLDSMRRWESSLIRHMETSHPEIGKSIVEEKRITPETEEKLIEALTTFMSTWQ
jgi:F0F1-type ATP synthase alpha subunit